MRGRRFAGVWNTNTVCVFTTSSSQKVVELDKGSIIDKVTWTYTILAPVSAHAHAYIRLCIQIQTPKYLIAVPPDARGPDLQVNSKAPH